MSKTSFEEKLTIIKNLLKELHKGTSIEELKSKFKDEISKIKPFEIPLIEQQLVKEGIKIDDILKLCDLHVALFREALKKQELKDVPKGHPVDLLMRENEWILKNSEILGLYASQLVNTNDVEKARNLLQTLLKITGSLRKIRVHYRKIQMLIFPYLERRGIIAVPRVLWGREDQIIVKLRKFYDQAVKALDSNNLDAMKEAGKIATEIAQEIGELVFRENKILFPAVYVLFSEGEWAAISKIADEIGWIIDTEPREWRPQAEPKYPYMISGVVTKEQLEKLPRELVSMAMQKGIEPDNYDIKKPGDEEYDTGFLNKEEVEGLFRALPLEITYANRDHRVRFYSESELRKGFVRTKTIVGRRLEFCHPPRLEKLVEKIAEEVISGKTPYREFWTKIGDNIIRVLISPVKNKNGEIIGVVEIVEDMTNIINKAEVIKKNILVL